MIRKLEPQRTFGRTGIEMPLIGYGTAPLGHEGVAREQAVRCLNHAIDHGITYLDTSPSYGSEEHIGEVMKTRRDEVFLATKNDKRSYDGVMEEIERSLERLKTDHVDLLQVHAVSAWADLEQALAPNGAVEALEEARQQGLTRYIGITGHSHPSLLTEALRRYRFDSVLIALSMADHLVTAPDRLFLPLAQEQGTAVIAMKVLLHGHAPDMGRALRYSLGLPGVSMAIVGMETIEEIDTAVEIAANYEPLSEEELEQHVAEVKPLLREDWKQSKKGRGPLFWLHDISVTGWEEHDEPEMVTY